MPKGREYNTCYSYTCLILVVFTFFAQNWSRTILFKMAGFGIKGKDQDEKYAIAKAIPDWDFGFLAGPAYSIPFALMLLITGSMADRINRKNMIVFSCFCWGGCTLAMSWADSLGLLIALRMLVGFFHSFFAPV